MDAVIAAVVASKEGYGQAQVSLDAPGILHDGMRIYAMARNSAEAHVRETERKSREAEAAARKARGRG